MDVVELDQGRTVRSIHPAHPLDPTLAWLLTRMIDEWGPAGVKAAVDIIVGTASSPPQVEVVRLAEHGNGAVCVDCGGTLVKKPVYGVVAPDGSERSPLCEDDARGYARTSEEAAADG